MHPHKGLTFADFDNMEEMYVGSHFGTVPVLELDAKIFQFRLWTFFSPLGHHALMGYPVLELDPILLSSSRTGSVIKVQLWNWASSARTGVKAQIPIAAPVPLGNQCLNWDDELVPLGH